MKKVFVGINFVSRFYLLMGGWSQNKKLYRKVFLPVNRYVNERLANSESKRIRVREMVELRIVKGDSVSMYVENLSIGEYAEIDDKSLQSASLIKLYIVGCVYEECEKKGKFDSEEIESLIQQMLTKSDNDATNSHSA